MISQFRETMLSTGVSSMILMNRSRLMPILPNRVMKIWDKWELRVMVLLSLSLQILLVLPGSRRKYTARNWVGVITWLAYLSADWVAAVFHRNPHESRKDKYHPPSAINSIVPDAAVLQAAYYFNNFKEESHNKLAKCLQSLETEEQWQCEQKWEMMSHVWVEMPSRLTLLTQISQGWLRIRSADRKSCREP